MRFLVFDTETTGLPQTKYISPTTLHQWPHIVQFSYVIYDTSLNDLVVSKDCVIKLPDGIHISAESTGFHGITNELSASKGVELDAVLTEFIEHLKTADKLIGHNIEFDLNVTKVAILRLINDSQTLTKDTLLAWKHDFHYLTHYEDISCTLKESVQLCNIQRTNKSGKQYLKFPKLIELHETLFAASPTNLHNSFNDILVTLRCFMKMNYDVDLNETCAAFKRQASLIGL